MPATQHREAMVDGRIQCRRCGPAAPGRITLTDPGWVVVECQCGETKEITSADALALQRAAIVKAAVMPASPPSGVPIRPVEADRRKAIAHDMWRRGVIDDAAYQRVLAE